MVLDPHGVEPVGQRAQVVKAAAELAPSRRHRRDELLEELVELVREDAERLDCTAEMEHAREIVARGTSADRQLDAYHAACAAGADQAEALRAVVDLLIEDTLTGLDVAGPDVD